MEEFWTETLPDISKGDLFIRKGIKYPFYLFTSDHRPKFKLNENLFIASWNEEEFKIPSEIQNIKEELLKPTKERHESFGRKWYNDAICRLSQVEINFQAEQEEIYLHFQKTNYEDHIVTNVKLNCPILDSGKKTIRKKYAPLIKNIIDLKESKLANPLGTSIFIVNPKEMKGVIGIRSEFVAIHPGFYCLAGGQIMAENYIDFENGKPNPFLAAAREAESEFNGFVKREDLICLGIGIDLVCGHPNILFLALTDIDTKEIVEYTRKERVEFSDFIEVDISRPKELFKYLDPNRIASNNATCAILSAEHLLPETYLRKAKSSQRYFKWKKDLFKMDYNILIQRKPDGKGLMIINNESFRAVEITEQQTDMCIIMANKLQEEAKNRVQDIGYVSMREFKENVPDWYPEKASASYVTQDHQVLNQISKIRARLTEKGYSSNLIETITGKARLSTDPDKVEIREK